MPGTATSTDFDDHGGRFRHEALFYADAEQFVEGTGGFVEAALSAGEPVMVAVLRHRAELLKARLGTSAAYVTFADMAELGRNPARIIPAWRRFVDQHGDAASLRGIGEPIWADRSAEELTECQRHEALVNMAFEGGRPWWLLCPYDRASLGPDVLDEARRSHRYLLTDGCSSTSDVYDGWPLPYGGQLPDPPADARCQRFDARALTSLRSLFSQWTASVLPDGRAAEMVLAAHELATNSVRHGGGGGELRFWREGTTAVAEVRDLGWLNDPLAGRRVPSSEDGRGRGLWLVNQLCDLMQVRSTWQGTVVRIRISS
ncbi:MAG TPA: sensor histidine kinase [Acidimicrobiales bacterium]|nr:sensor histidine kinase [Acidimicrobiales bacterium]